MGFDIRVNNGRCPPILIGGCILLVVILVNWWSFSSQNSDLTKQNDILEEQMKICCSERDQCTNYRSTLETNVGQLKTQIDRQKSDNIFTYNALKRQENVFTMCKTELDSLKNLDASKTESLNTLRANLEEKKEEIKRLNEQLKTLSTAAKNADTYNNKNTVPNDDIPNSKNEEGDVEDITDTYGKDGERDKEMANNV